MGLELAWSYWKGRTIYRLNDAVTNISCGILDQLTGLFAKIFTVAAYHFIFINFALFELETTWYWILIGFLGVDFFYYWAHRMSHQVNVFWLGHVVHHQSEDYNLSVALRQSTFQKMFTFYFYFPLAFLGFKTEWFLLMGAFNLLYQFWIHTEVIDKLPRWYEYIFNTPAHHRVHHGRDPKYIDKNHGGTLIIWDRIFGTFQQEEERPTYGITTPADTWNPVKANLQPFARLWEEIKTVPGFMNKIKLAIMPPGWYPEELGGFRPPKPVDKATYHKFDTAVSPQLNWYLAVQYLAILAGTSVFLFNFEAFSLLNQGIIAMVIVFSVMALGMLFESKIQALRIEVLRFIFIAALILYLFSAHFVGLWLLPFVIVLALLSIFWLSHIKYSSVEVAKQ
jgi:sterol desaturase/sphingolipid hydroxylase (fatty acid hydroxylase superfamily)